MTTKQWSLLTIVTFHTGLAVLTCASVAGAWGVNPIFGGVILGLFLLGWSGWFGFVTKTAHDSEAKKKAAE